MDDVQDDLMNDVRLIKLIFPSSLLRKFFSQISVRRRRVRESLTAESAYLAAEWVAKLTENGRSQLSACGVDMKTHENWRSQLFGRGVDFAESIFLLARLAESIFRDVMNLKF